MCCELRLPPVELTPARARHAVERWLWDLGAPADAILDAALAASELVTDGLVLDPGGELVLRGDRTGDAVVIDVETVPPEVGDVETLTGPAAKGRLPLVTALAATVTVRKERSGHHHLACQIPLGY